MKTLLKKEPKLLPGLGRFYRAWWNLDTERQLYDWGIGPIPWSAIRRYGHSIGYRARDLDYFVEVMRRVDVEFRSKDMDRRKAETPKVPSLQVPGANVQGSSPRPQKRTRGRNARG